MRLGEGECVVVTRALKRSVWDRCHGRVAHWEHMDVGVRWLGGGVDKDKCDGAGVSDVVDRNVWGCESMAPAVGVAWVM